MKSKAVCGINKWLFTSYVDSKGEGAHEMSTLLNKYHKSYHVKLSIRGGGASKPCSKKCCKFVKAFQHKIDLKLATTWQKHF